MEQVGTLYREAHIVVDGADGELTFTRRGESIPALKQHDVALPIMAEAGEDGLPVREVWPPCPDCGWALVWAEAGGWPGSRVCAGRAAESGMHAMDRDAVREAGCGSTFIDDRYGVLLQEWA